MSDKAYTVGDYWLAKRRDGKAPDIWQIARKHAGSVVYRSTHKRSLEDAKSVIHAFVEQERAKGPQDESAKVIPQLMLYWNEHGCNVVAPAQIASSLRAWIGFLMTEDANATIADINPALIGRFKKWRMGPHEYNVPWGGKEYPHTSKGVSGETVQRNLEDFRAALNYAESNRRIPFVPRIPMMEARHRSKPRDVVIPLPTLGAMLAYSERERAFNRWLALMIGTACRPDTALHFDPALQWHGDTLDLQHPDRPVTKKRNPVIPCIEPLKPYLDGADGAKSRKTAWRTMRRVLDLPASYVPKTIRHTVATELRQRGTPIDQIEMLLGHRVGSRTTNVYAKYDPDLLAKTKVALTTIFEEVQAHAAAWKSDHSLTIPKRGMRLAIDNIGATAQKYEHKVR